MTLENEKFCVTIEEDPCYTTDSADNKPYDVVWNPMGIRRTNDYMNRALAIEVCQGEEGYRGILLAELLGLDRKDCVILTDDQLTVLCFQGLIQVDIASREVVFYRELSILGGTMAIYPCPEGIDGYVVWGETEIVKLNRNFEVEWTKSGADIFVSLTEKPAFQMTKERIVLNDFLGNHYELDYRGNILLFRPGTSDT